VGRAVQNAKSKMNPSRWRFCTARTVCQRKHGLRPGCGVFLRMLHFHCLQEWLTADLQVRLRAVQMIPWYLEWSEAWLHEQNAPAFAVQIWRFFRWHKPARSRSPSQERYSRSRGSCGRIQHGRDQRVLSEIRVRTKGRWPRPADQRADVHRHLRPQCKS